jgi:hypothetical protein
MNVLVIDKRSFRDGQIVTGSRGERLRDALQTAGFQVELRRNVDSTETPHNTWEEIEAWAMGEVAKYMCILLHAGDEQNYALRFLAKCCTDKSVLGFVGSVAPPSVAAAFRKSPLHVLYPEPIAMTNPNENQLCLLVHWVQEIEKAPRNSELIRRASNRVSGFKEVLEADLQEMIDLAQQGTPYETLLQRRHSKRTTLGE